MVVVVKGQQEGEISGRQRESRGLGGEEEGELLEGSLRGLEGLWSTAGCRVRSQGEEGRLGGCRPCSLRGCGRTLWKCFSSASVFLSQVAHQLRARTGEGKLEDGGERRGLERLSGNGENEWRMAMAKSMKPTGDPWSWISPDTSQLLSSILSIHPQGQAPGLWFGQVSTTKGETGGGSGGAVGMSHRHGQWGAS